MYPPNFKTQLQEALTPTLVDLWSSQMTTPTPTTDTTPASIVLQTLLRDLDQLTYNRTTRSSGHVSAYASERSERVSPDVLSPARREEFYRLTAASKVIALMQKQFNRDVEKFRTELNAEGLSCYTTDRDEIRLRESESAYHDRLKKERDDAQSKADTLKEKLANLRSRILQAAAAGKSLAPLVKEFYEIQAFVTDLG